MSASTYVSLSDAKDHLAIDQELTIHDRRIAICIGAAEDWAENFTCRSLSELMLLDSPADANQSAAPDPKDSPGPPLYWNPDYPQPPYLSLPQESWMAQDWQHYWGHNPIQMDQSKPLRRDAYSAILLYMESLFDRNTDNLALLQTAAMNLIMPYRIAMGV